MRDLLGCAIDDRLEHDASIDLVVAVEHASQRGLRFLDRHFGQKAEAAKIHAEDRNALRRDQPRDAEQRAVAAEHDDQVGTIGEVMPLDALGADFLRGLRVGDRSLVPCCAESG